MLSPANAEVVYVAIVYVGDASGYVVYFTIVCPSLRAELLMAYIRPTKQVPQKAHLYHPVKGKD